MGFSVTERTSLCAACSEVLSREILGGAKG